MDAELFDLAKAVGEFDSRAGSRLASLAQAVAPGATPSGWTGIDVYKAIDPATVVVAARDTHLVDRGLGRLEQLRNFLALVPVFLTWIGLMFAGMGYRDAVRADPALLNRPFLLLWEEGFQGHGPALVSWLTLSNIAFMDMVIIGGMLAITWRIHNELNVKQARREEQAAALEQRLHHAVWGASLVLAEKGSQATVADRFAQVASGLLDELRAERERIGQLANERERNVAGLRDFTTGVKKVTADMVHSSTEIHRGLSILNQIFSTVETRVGALAQAQATLEQALMQASTEMASVGASQAATLSQFDVTSRLLEDAVQQSANVTLGVGTAVGQLRAEMLDLRRQLLDERKAYQQTAQSTDHAARVLEQALQATSSGAQELGYAATTIHGLLDPLSRIPDRIGQATYEQAMAASALSNTSGQMAHTMIGANDRLQSAAQALAYSAATLNSLVPVLQSLANVNAELAHQVRAAVTSFPTTDVLVDAWRNVQTEWVDALRATQNGHVPHERRWWWQRQQRGAK